MWKLLDAKYFQFVVRIRRVGLGTSADNMTLSVYQLMMKDTKTPLMSDLSEQNSGTEFQ